MKHRIVPRVLSVTTRRQQSPSDNKCQARSTPRDRRGEQSIYPRGFVLDNLRRRDGAKEGRMFSFDAEYVDAAKFGAENKLDVPFLIPDENPER